MAKDDEWWGCEAVVDATRMSKCDLRVMVGLNVHSELSSNGVIEKPTPVYN